MMERNLFKTRLCVLYKRGRCNRPSCSFAHGEAELRRFGSSVPGNIGILLLFSLLFTILLLTSILLIFAGVFYLY